MNRFLTILGCACVICGSMVRGDAPKPSAPTKSATPTKAPPAAQPTNDKLRVVEMAVHPAPAPRPALKLRLLPDLLEQTPQDAVPLYLKAIALLGERKDAKVLDKVVQWLETPVAKLPREEVRTTLSQFNSVLRYTEMTARRSLCNWAVPLQEEENPFATNLPELQQARNLARLLALRARWQIAEGKHTAAIDTLKTGYALARHVGDQPYLVSSLVSIAVVRLMDEQLMALIQSPGSPNLYWPLTALPDPLVDMRPGFEGEMVWIYYYFREVHEVRTAKKASPQQWQAVFDGIVPKIQALTTLTDDADKSAPALQGWQKALLLTTATAAVPYARQNLIARGWPEKEVQAMTPAQVLVRDFFETYDEFRDEMFKWFHVPYWQARPAIAKAEQQLREACKDKVAMWIHRPGTILAGLLLPAVSRCYFVHTSARREIAALRCIEAIRLYAAGNGGKLPQRLDDISEVPIPINPVTGKAFPYRVEGEAAILLADGPKEEPQTEYRIKMAKP